MRTIYKYPLEITDEQVIKISLFKYICESIVRVDLDPLGQPCIWCEVETTSKPLPVIIFIVGTGNPIPDEAKHIGSFIQGPFVWHVYLLKEN